MSEWTQPVTAPKPEPMQAPVKPQGPREVLRPRQTQILEFLKANPWSTIEQVAQAVEIKATNADVLLRNMLNAGRVERRGEYGRREFGVKA